MRSIAPVLLFLLLAGCQPQEPGGADRPVPADGGKAASRTVYSYVDDRGRIRMVSSVEAIPERFRGQVLATDTGRERQARLSTDRVVVLDLRKREKGKPLNYSVVDLRRMVGRPAPEDAHEPVRDPGALGRRLVRRGAERVRGLLGLAPARAEVRVVLYTAPWCGFCKKAAAYLREKGVAFVERDIEAGRSAAVELDRKLRAAGLVGGGVPVLDIGGTIVIGFDRSRIDRLLE